jgi:hypothetical protein
MDRKKVFESIYKNNIWSHSSSTPLSGIGSTLKSTQSFRDYLDMFCEEKNIQTIVDLGCGDLTWIPTTNFFKTKRYIGVDIVASLIESHKITYPKQSFFVIDIVTDPLPKGDVAILRDVLFHLNMKDIQIIIDKLKGQYSYLFVTSCLNSVNNHAIQHTFHPINLEIEPFNLKGYIDKIHEIEWNRNILLFDLSR